MGSSLRRGALVLAAVVLLTAAVLPGRPVARAATAHVPSRAAMGELVIGDGTRVVASAASARLAEPGRGDVCIVAHRITVQGTLRTAARESGCSTIAYEVDPVSWHARATGTMPTALSVEVRRWDGERWHLVSARLEDRRAAVDLRWQGHGETRHSAGARPFPCYGPGPLCVDSHATATRSSAVAGTIALGGLGSTISIPRAHPGELVIGFG